ncbi:hypothetical protein ACLOJK_011943 [Asimina triloba]
MVVSGRKGDYLSSCRKQQEGPGLGLGAGAASEADLLFSSSPSPVRLSSFASFIPPKKCDGTPVGNLTSLHLPATTALLDDFGDA